MGETNVGNVVFIRESSIEIRVRTSDGEHADESRGVILSMSDVPLGFGVCAKSTQECRKADPSAVVCFHQADIGEYLRAEDDMVPGKKE